MNCILNELTFLPFSNNSYLFKIFWMLSEIVKLNISTGFHNTEIKCSQLEVCKHDWIGILDKLNHNRHFEYEIGFYKVFHIMRSWIFLNTKLRKSGIFFFSFIPDHIVFVIFTEIFKLPFCILMVQPDILKEIKWNPH